MGISDEGFACSFTYMNPRVKQKARMSPVTSQEPRPLSVVAHAHCGIVSWLAT